MNSAIKTHRTTIEIDVPAFEGARKALGTAGYKETVNEALRIVSRGEMLQRGAEAIRSGALGLIGPAELTEQRRASDLVTRYLADTSVWAWAQRSERADIREKLAERYETGEVVTCVPVVLEAMHRPETGREYEERLNALFAPLERLPLGAADVERALEVQRELARASDGSHRRPAIDFLIAAVAEAAGQEVILWSFDRDLSVICEHTGQPAESEESTGPGH